ncbi:3-dehydroquinate synthase II [Desulfobotulus alkaliphilus]|uniref:3-dehydroquinate synthase II n=1 Tax=Desulfobotulus alkaliphilus TaxID=622671 RepID=A0A562R9M1_9BACT|nr:3-dehydroquinate synthase II [Desulfobotulus alkaliphilus]TWI65742.1 3-dehydroquinate synthase II [Desulfobotulus alkaliphilus]
MREIWVKIAPWNKELVLTALEGGAHGLWVEDGRGQDVAELARIPVIASDGDFVPGETSEIFKISDGSQEEAVAALSVSRLVVLECTDWTIIPLENLIAKKADVMPVVRSFEEARTAFGILEVGVRRVMLDIQEPAALQAALSGLQEVHGSEMLEEAVVTEIRPLGMGDRVCVDTCTSMLPGQGMLVGDSSSALFLVHAETESNPYVAPRPFRVNAGAVHAYTRVDGGRTRYLAELKAGDSVMLVDSSGNTSPAVVGRVKIEKRPLLLIRAEVAGKGIHTIVQNAETIRLTAPGGRPVSVVSITPGDRVLVCLEEGGRHFGHAVEETITEQ